MRIKSLVATFLFFILIPLAYAQDITREDALSALQQAELDMNKMSEDGLSINSINDTLMLAKQALERADFADLLRTKASGELAEMAKKSLEGLDYSGFTYTGVLEYTQEIAARKQKAYGLLDSIEALEIKVQEYKEQLVDISEANTLLENTRIAFENERYDEAEAMLAEANSNLENKKAELTTLNVMVRSGKNLFVKNWRALTIFAVVLIIIGFFSWKKIKAKNLRKKIKRLKAEKEALVNLLKKAQTQRYKEGKISGLVYNVRTERYNKKLDDIKEMLPSLEAMLKRSENKKDMVKKS